MQVRSQAGAWEREENKPQSLSKSLKFSVRSVAKSFVFIMRQ